MRESDPWRLWYLLLVNGDKVLRCREMRSDSPPKPLTLSLSPCETPLPTQHYPPCATASCSSISRKAGPATTLLRRFDPSFTKRVLATWELLILRRMAFWFSSSAKRLLR